MSRLEENHDSQTLGRGEPTTEERKLWPLLLLGISLLVTSGLRLWREETRKEQQRQEFLRAAEQQQAWSALTRER